MWDDLKRHWKSGSMLSRLVLINVLTFLVILTLQLCGRLRLLPAMDEGVFGLATTWNLQVLLARPWSMITHMFVHVDVWHMGVNMLWLYWIGRLYMVQFGSRRLVSTYFVSGLAGFFIYALFTNVFPALQEATFAYGASAAVMGVMAAMATARPNYQVRFFILGSLSLKYVALGWVLLDYFALGNGLNSGGNLAHLGGAAFGYLMMKQSHNGRDWVLWFERFLDRLTGWFKRDKSTYKSNWRTVKNSRSHRAKSDEDYNLEKMERQKRMDSILDKISKHGYENLTAEEKDFLFRQSQQ